MPDAETDYTVRTEAGTSAIGEQFEIMNYLREGFLDNWFVVDGCSGQPEGDINEWREIIAAIKEKKDLRHTRVGVKFQNGIYSLFSPRNQSGKNDTVMFDEREMQDWLVNAEALLKQHESAVEGGERNKKHTRARSD